MSRMVKLDDVKTYSGYKTTERPISFKILNKEVQVAEILERKLTEDPGQKRVRREIFKIRGNDRKIYLIIYDLNNSEWFIKL